MRWLAPLLVMAAPALAQTAEPTATTATFGNWTVSCVQGQAGKQCQMATKLNLKGEDGQVRPLLDMAIGAAVDGSGLRIVLQVPMDVALRVPVSLSTGGDEGAAGTEIVSASYLACLQGGCLADAALTGESLAVLQGAGMAKVAFTVLNGNRKVVVPVDLAGFGDAWAALGLQAP